MQQSIGPGLRRYWRRLSRLPGGKWLFSRLIGFYAPYSGSIGARVVELRPGHGVVTLRDHRAVRNHLGSVHAIALANLAEMVTGLTLMNSLPEQTRGILTGLSLQYHHKARGWLRAECDCEIPLTNETREISVYGAIRDRQGELLVSATAQWLIGPVD